jgi:hypothetical protein
MRITLGLLTCALFVASCGCGVELTKQEGDRRAASGVGGIAMPDVATPPANSNGDAAATEEPAAEPAATEDAAPTEDASAEDNTVREKAKTGAGKKGRYEGSGAVVTPLKAYFRTQQRVVYEIQIPQAMQLFQATNGYYPRTQEEFDSQILQANGIKLPELPPGHKYVYDPKLHELMVEKPAP